MKPSFNFMDLLPFQLLGVLGAVFLVLGFRTTGLLSVIGFVCAVLLWIAAVKSVPMRKRFNNGKH